MKCTCEDYYNGYQCSACDEFDRCVDTVAILEEKMKAVEKKIAEFEAYIKANTENGDE